MNHNLKQSERFLIPGDVIFEIAQIILQVGLSHEIVDVKEDRRLIVLCVEYDGKSTLHKQAIENITEILQTYHDIFFNGDKRMNWREY